MSLLRFSYTSRTVSLICLFSPGVHFRTVLEVVTHILSILNCFLSWAFVSCFCYSWHISLCGRDILSLSSGLRRSLKPEKFSRLICWWQPFLNLGMIYLVESKTVRWREPKFVLFSRFFHWSLIFEVTVTESPMRVYSTTIDLYSSCKSSMDGMTPLKYKIYTKVMLLKMGWRSIFI